MMKKLLVATAVAAISTSAVANDYRFEVDASYLNDEISKNADLTTYLLGGTFYLAPVDDSGAPKAEAAFLEQASSVSLGWGRTNVDIDEFESKIDEDGDVWALSGRYITDSGFILGLSYASTEIDDVDVEALGVDFGYYLSDTSSLTLSYLGTEVDDLDSEDDAWSLGYKALYNNRFGVEADLVYIDAEYGEDAYGIDGALDYYFNENFSVGGVLGFVASDDAYTEAVVYGIKTEYYFNSNIALNAGYVVSSPDKGDDNKVWSIGLVGRF